MLEIPERKQMNSGAQVGAIEGMYLLKFRTFSTSTKSDPTVLFVFLSDWFRVLPSRYLDQAMVSYCDLDRTASFILKP